MLSRSTVAYLCPKMIYYFSDCSKEVISCFFFFFFLCFFFFLGGGGLGVFCVFFLVFFFWCFFFFLGGGLMLSVHKNKLLPNNRVLEPQGLGGLVNVLLEGWLGSLNIGHDLAHPPDDRVAVQPHQTPGEVFWDS